MIPALNTNANQITVPLASNTNRLEDFIISTKKSKDSIHQLHQSTRLPFTDLSITMPTATSSLITTISSIHPLLAAPIYLLSFIMGDLFFSKNNP